MAALFGNGESSVAAAPRSNNPAPATGAAPAAANSVTSAPLGGNASDLNSLISGAAGDLADYQRLTAEGKLGEAGQKLDALKRKLEQLNTLKR
jgi:hypothetical protein